MRFGVRVLSGFVRVNGELGRGMGFGGRAAAGTTALRDVQVVEEGVAAFEVVATGHGDETHEFGVGEGSHGTVVEFELAFVEEQGETDEVGLAVELRGSLALLPVHGAAESDLIRIAFVPVAEGGARDVEFRGEVAKGTALGAEFDEAVDGLDVGFHK